MLNRHRPRVHSLAPKGKGYFHYESIIVGKKKMG